jgi:hypothetical protein
MRYLEQCVADLKASHRSRRDSPTPTSPKAPRLPPPAPRNEPEDEDDDGEEDEDEDMEDAVSPTHVVNSEPRPSYRFTNASPAVYPSDRSVHSCTTSPALYPTDARHYSATASPAIHPSDPHHYSLAPSVRSGPPLRLLPSVLRLLSAPTHHLIRNFRIHSLARFSTEDPFQPYPVAPILPSHPQHWARNLTERTMKQLRLCSC